MSKKRMIPVLLFLLVLCECGTEEGAGENFVADTMKSIRVTVAADAPGCFVIGGRQYGYCTELLSAYAESTALSLETNAKVSSENLRNNLENNSADVGIALSAEVDPEALSLPVCCTRYVMLGRDTVRDGGSLSGTVGAGKVFITPGFGRTADYDVLLDSLTEAQLFVCPRESYELACEVAEGRADYLVCEMSDALMAEGLLPGLTIIHRFGEDVEMSLVFSPSRRDLYEDFVSWMDEYRGSREELALKRSYFEEGPISRTGRYGNDKRAVNGISVWDGLIKKVGEREGVDWRLLSAIAYKESRFHHNVTSHRGATGLMQIMPVTARHFKVEESALSDPEVNITLAAKLIKSIDRSLAFSPSTPTEDRLSIILAAYNCGIGTVLDARSLAQVQGWNPDSWASVSQCLELMGDSDYRCDSVSYRRFRGWNETLAFVDGVRSKYNAYRRIVK